MNTESGHQGPLGFDESCCSDGLILFVVVAPLSAITFWIAGWTAYFWLEFIRRSNQEVVHNDFGANAIVSIFLPTVILGIIGVAWLILRAANAKRGYVIPGWTAVIAATIALIVIAGQATTDFYTSWWPLVALGFIVCLSIYIGFLSHLE